MRGALLRFIPEGFQRRVLLTEAEQGHGLVVCRRGTGRLADLLLGST